jgi:tRNA-splicing ligase RtcB
LGYGTEDDLRACEDGGCMPSAQPALVSDQAKKRGADQIGTLGSGNHFLEIQYVDEIFDAEVAHAFGLTKNMVTVMIHCGSRGLGHQVCTDYVRAMIQTVDQWGYELPDRELVCAPFTSSIAQEYCGAMAAACNYAWANRHMIAHWTRKAWQSVVPDVQLHTVYDVSHNIGKQEMHEVNGVQKQMIVHRKGATRAFGPGNSALSEQYRAVGQPVLVPGTMGTASYVMVGTTEGMDVSFASCCHGAGRQMSRTQARAKIHGRQLRDSLEARGIKIRARSNFGLAEEAPIAYKDIEAVIDVVHNASLARKVARLKPCAVIKGE